jgi:hypothetical protein
MRFTVKDVFLHKLYISIRFQTKKNETLIKLTDKWNLINNFTFGVRKSINVYDPYLVFLYIKNALNFLLKHIFSGGRSLFVNKFIFLNPRYPIYLLQLNQLISKHKWNAGAISNFYKAFSLNFIDKTYGSTFFFFKRIFTFLRFFKKKRFFKYVRSSLRKKRLLTRRFPTLIVNFHYDKESITIDKECARFGIPNIAITEGYTNPLNISHPVLAGISANPQQHNYIINIFIDTILYAFFKRIEKIRKALKSKKSKFKIIKQSRKGYIRNFSKDRIQIFRNAYRDVYVFFKNYPRFSYKRSRVIHIFRTTVLDEYGERNFFYRRINAGKWNRTTAVGFSDPNSTIELSRRFKRVLKRKFRPRTIRERFSDREPGFFFRIRNKLRLHPNLPKPTPHKIYYKRFEYLLTSKKPVDLYKSKYKVLIGIRTRIIGTK